jgi:glyoxylase-like metal-dependent hydrolase (beta-lactamase superfamily II)
MLLNNQAGIYKVELPLLHRVKHVNCYALRGRDGWSLLDAGLSREASYQAWLRFFEEQAIGPADIMGIYITHYHSDHYGCAGWLQKLSGAPVYIGAIDAVRINNYWKKGDYLLPELDKLYNCHGMPSEVRKLVLEAEAEIIPYTVPHAELTVLQAGQTVTLGDYEFRVILTPGHSDGHICFYNQEQGLLFSGDHLLPDSSSIIGLSVQAGARPDPLADFLRSLGSLRSLDCQLILPAHGKSFPGLAKRISRLESYHNKHLAAISNCLGRGAAAYEVCRQIYGPDLSGNELRFAMAEILAHLVYLLHKNEVEITCTEGIYKYKNR